MSASMFFRTRNFRHFGPRFACCSHQLSPAQVHQRVQMLATRLLSVLSFSWGSKYLPQGVDWKGIWRSVQRVDLDWDKLNATQAHTLHRTLTLCHQLQARRC